MLVEAAESERLRQVKGIGTGERRSAGPSRLDTPTNLATGRTVANNIGIWPRIWATAAAVLAAVSSLVPPILGQLGPQPGSPRNVATGCAQRVRRNMDISSRVDVERVLDRVAVSGPPGHEDRVAPL